LTDGADERGPTKNRHAHPSTGRRSDNAVGVVDEWRGTQRGQATVCRRPVLEEAAFADTVDLDFGRIEAEGGLGPTQGNRGGYQQINGEVSPTLAEVVSGDRLSVVLLDVLSRLAAA
jgi:hypothetical protein